MIFSISWAADRCRLRLCGSDKERFLREGPTFGLVERFVFPIFQVFLHWDSWFSWIFLKTVSISVFFQVKKWAEFKTQKIKMKSYPMWIRYNQYITFSFIWTSVTFYSVQNHTKIMFSEFYKIWYLGWIPRNFKTHNF